MSLIIWTSTSLKHVRETVGGVLSAWGPPPHSVLVDAQTTLPSTKPNDVVLAMGSKALKCLQAAKLVPKNRTISSIRETPVTHEGATYLVTFDTGVREIDHGMEVKLQIDTALACRIVTTGKAEPVLGEYRYVKDFTEACAYLEEKIQQGERPPVSVDLETLTLDPYSPSTWIVSISITYRKGQADVVRFKGATDNPGYHDTGDILWGQVAWLLNNPNLKVRGANFKYDQAWLMEKWGIRCTNFAMDTTLVGSLLDENRSNSLETHTKIYTAMGGYDAALNTKYDKGRMDLVPDEDLLPYAGGDTDAAYQVSQAQARELSADKRLLKFYKTVLHPASQAFLQMERTGVLVDVPHFIRLQEELSDEIRTIEERALNVIPRRLRLKYRDNLSLGRARLLTDFLFTPRGLNLKPEMYTDKAPEAPEFIHASTAMKHLLAFANHPDAGPFIDLLQMHSKASKTLSTYVVGFMKHLRADGRFHPTAILYKGSYGDDGDESGTVTGRLAFKDPAMQTLPKHTPWAPKLRAGYIAPPGYVIVSWDYSQGELRITACLANEPNMLAAYRQNIDLHLRTGAQLKGISLEDALGMMKSGDPEALDLIKRIRQGGKAGNFGLIYGMSAAGYQSYAYYTYGVKLTMEEAEQQRDAFFALYAGLSKWHSTYKTAARQMHRVRSPLGRLRHLPLINSSNSSVRGRAERQSINSPVQSTLSDMSCWALAEFMRQYGTPAGCQFFNMTHDSLGAYVKEDELDIWVPRVTLLMETLPFDMLGWKPQLKFVTDCEVGSNLGDMQKAA